MINLPENSSPLPVVVVTRFAYLGRSGWQVPPEDQERVLFDPDRLASRLDLFRTIAVASLVRQSDRDFHHYILTSMALPTWARDELNQICRSAYGRGTYTIDARKPSLARRFLQNFLEKKYGSDPVVQVVLDDDNGLASDFMAEMKADVAAHIAQPDPAMPYFFSWPAGYGCVFEGQQRPRIYAHRYRFINLGLTMISTSQQKNILAIDHRKAPPKLGVTEKRRRTMFVRSLHGHNDSRVHVTSRWSELPDWPTNQDIASRFAFMLDFAEHP